MQTYLRLNNEACESFMEYIKQILAQANSFGSRSSILSILAWIFGSILGSITLASIFDAPQWVLIGLFSILVIMILSILIAFFYCLFTGKTDVLRSEKFNLEKLFIERQTASDSLTGVQNTDNSAKTLNVNPVQPVQED